MKINNQHSGTPWMIFID